MSSAKALSGGSSTAPVIRIFSPPRSFMEGLGTFPLIRIFSCSISCCTRTRLTSGSWATSHWSRRVPAAVGGTERICCGDISAIRGIVVEGWWMRCRGESLCRHRLCEHQPVSVQVHHVELHHPVILRTKLTRYLHSRQSQVLLIQRFHVVRHDVHVPRVALAPSRIIRRYVPRLLLQENLDLITTQDREARWIILRLEPELLV